MNVPIGFVGDIFLNYVAVAVRMLQEFHLKLVDLLSEVGQRAPQLAIGLLHVLLVSPKLLRVLALLDAELVGGDSVSLLGFFSVIVKLIV
jgi:hypothetical protein